MTSGTSTDGVWTIEALTVAPDSAVSLRGAAFRKPGSTATVLYFGGNGFVLGQHHDYMLEIYRDLPVDVIAFDHRGYGGSGGSASMDGLLADGVLLYDHVAAMAGVAERPLILHGHSLGSFIAGHVATNRALGGLVLESSATSAEEWVEGFKDRPFWVRKVGVDSTLAGKGNSGAMASLDEPVLIVVGKNDTTTRPEMSYALFEQAVVPESSKELLVVDGAGHMNATKGAPYRDAFLRLLERVQPANQHHQPDR